MPPFCFSPMPMEQDPNLADALGLYMQSCNNLQSVLFNHNDELLLKSTINKFLKFNTSFSEKEVFCPISLFSSFHPFQNEQLYPFEIVQILKLLRAECERITASQDSADSHL